MPLRSKRSLTVGDHSHALPPPTLPGFEHIKRFWDKENALFSAKIVPGEYYVTVDGEMITTVLGSCVSACIRDKMRAIGGMNHFMLPLDHSNGNTAWGAAASAATRYGSVAMERLINEIIKHGGRRDHLEVKLVGGGNVLGGMKTDVGAENIEFVKNYLRNEGLHVVGEDLGGVYPRKIQYFPKTGKLRVKTLVSERNRIVVEKEEKLIQTFDKHLNTGDVELF